MPSSQAHHSCLLSKSVSDQFYGTSNKKSIWKTKNQQVWTEAEDFITANRCSSQICLHSVWKYTEHLYSVEYLMPVLQFILLSIISRRQRYDNIVLRLGFHTMKTLGLGETGYSGDCAHHYSCKVSWGLGRGGQCQIFFISATWPFDDRWEASAAVQLEKLCFTDTTQYFSDNVALKITFIFHLPSRMTAWSMSLDWVKSLLAAGK